MCMCVCVYPTQVAGYLKVRTFFNFFKQTVSKIILYL